MKTTPENTDRANAVMRDMRRKKLMENNNASVVNIDATLVLQKPKVAEYIEKMRQNIAFALSCDLSRINVKATTEERLGFTGREEGVSAYAVALLEIKNSTPN